MSTPFLQKLCLILAVWGGSAASILSIAEEPAGDPHSAFTAARDAGIKALDEREAAEREKLGLSYRAAVEKSRADAQARGDLDAVVAWKEELSRLDQWPVLQAPATFSAQASVLAYQQRLTSLLQAREAAYGPAKRLILEKYTAALDDHIKNLVRSNRIDEALRLRPRLEEARAEIAALPAPPAPTPVPTVGQTTPPSPAPIASMPRLLTEIPFAAKPGEGAGAADVFPSHWKTKGRVLLAQTLVGPAVFMNGRDCSLEIPPQEELRLDNRSFSIAFWVQPISPARSNYLGWGQEEDEDRIRIGNLGGLKLRFQAGNDLLEADVEWKIWEWNHVVCVKDVSTQQLFAFLNGVPVGGRPGSRDGLYNLHHKPIFVGQPAGDSALGFSGLMARIRVYDHVFSASQASALFQQDRAALDAAQTPPKRQPASTAEQFSAAITQRVFTLSTRERPRRVVDDPMILLRADGTVSGPWEARWKALSKDTVDVFSGDNHHELQFDLEEKGPRTFKGVYKGPELNTYGPTRTGYLLE